MHQYRQFKGLRKAVAAGKGSAAEGSRGERLSWADGEYPPDCRTSGVLSSFIKGRDSGRFADF